MASGKDRRRRGGHPAKVAERRERERKRHGGGARGDALQAAAKAICRAASGLETALDAELWASELLGSWWTGALGPWAADPDLEIGGPLVEEIARIGGGGAVAALIAIGELSDSELGLRARDEADRLLASGAAEPLWWEAIVEPAVLRTAVMRDVVFDDGVTVFVEAAHDDGGRHAVGVYIDNNLGVMAKDILLADSIEQVERLVAGNPADVGEIRVEPIEPAEASARIHAAMELTDMTIEPPVGEDYPRLRALARLRADELPSIGVDVSAPELSSKERKRLLKDFLGSPEGDSFAPGTDASEIVGLAIDFCADYVDGRPLRWSPVAVELFMVDWLPRKLLAGADMFEAVPDALAGWVRYAGRVRAIPSHAIEMTVEAIAEWTEEMLARSADDLAGGPAKQFLAAAEDAGVDLGDEQAVASFIAGWNARADAD
jgi:hypothetical protein